MSISAKSQAIQSRLSDLLGDAVDHTNSTIIRLFVREELVVEGATERQATLADVVLIVV